MDEQYNDRKVLNREVLKARKGDYVIYQIDRLLDNLSQEVYRMEAYRQARGHSIEYKTIEEVSKMFPDEARKTGEWQISDAYPHNVYCSECHKKFAQTHWAVWEDGSLPRNFCPNCGARMEKDNG